MFHRSGALLVKDIRPANDAGWNGRKSPCCRPRVPCWCSWKLSFSRSNAGADCWWQRQMVVNSCRDQRWEKRVSFKFPISGETSSWGWTPARHQTTFLQSARSRSCWPVGMNKLRGEAHWPTPVCTVIFACAPDRSNGTSPCKHTGRSLLGVGAVWPFRLSPGGDLGYIWPHHLGGGGGGGYPGTCNL